MLVDGGWAYLVLSSFFLNVFGYHGCVAYFVQTFLVCLVCLACLCIAFVVIISLASLLFSVTALSHDSCRRVLSEGQSWHCAVNGC